MLTSRLNQFAWYRWSVFILLCTLFSFVKASSLKSISIEQTSYLSLNSFVDDLQLKSKFFDDNKKIILYHRNHRIVLSAGSSYFLINDEIFHLYKHVVFENNDFYVPSRSFIAHLKNQDIFNNINLDSSNEKLIINRPQFNILSYDVYNKNNGFSIDIHTSMYFDENLLAAWISDNNWLSISIPNAIADSSSIQEVLLQNPVTDIKIVQMDKAVQLSFLLNIIPDDFDIISSLDKISINLFTAQKKNADKIKEEKQKYIIDTIVLDAGHGGKDPGACVKSCSIQEKTITLDLTKKIGQKLKKSGFNVIYTREDDRFVTLNERTSIANESDADLFISIHVNSISNSPNTRGFETYLLRVGKTEEAIKEVEKRENSVITEYEDEGSYSKLSKINAIIIQDANIKQSGDFANLVQKELSLSINSKYDRGVKQAGFQVLWGVTVPNVLIEVGFITNSEERKNLTSDKYQNKVASGIVNAIISYKDKYEKRIIE